MMFQLMRLHLIGVVLLLTSNFAFGFTFSPMTASFDPEGSGATRAFQVENTDQKEIAVDISIAQRVVSESGAEEFRRVSDIEKQFLIYPPQIILKPKEKRNIRVSWIGEKKLKSEQAYRLIIEQLPVETEKKKEVRSGAVINMLLKYVAALYITPSGVKPNVHIKEAKVLLAGKKTNLKITFENSGNAHQVLNNLSLKITSIPKDSNAKPQVISIDSSEKILESIQGQNILAGNVRSFILPWPKEMPPGPVKVSFELQN